MKGIGRSIKTYNLVDPIIENDDHLYGLPGCLYIHQQTGIPTLFNSFHKFNYLAIGKLKENVAPLPS